MRPSIALRAPVVVAVSLLGFVASSRADEREDDARFAADRLAVRSAESGLVSWAKDEPVESPLRESVRDDADHARIAGRPLGGEDALTRNELANAARDLADLARRARARRREVLGEKPELATIDVSAIINNVPNFFGPGIGLPVPTRNTGKKTGGFSGFN